MDKTEFLKELKQYLDVLNESEQKDILDEYEQHIDMKMESGMSEQEAIGDFGNMEELATDILEAYHVNPMYRGKKKDKINWKEAIPVTNLEKAGEKLGIRGLEFIKHLGRKVSGGINWTGKILATPFLRLKEAWGIWQKRRYERREEYDLQVIELPERQEKMGIGEIPGKLAQGMSRMMIAMVHMMLWCVRWCWNICMIFVIGLTGMFMVMALFCTGTLGVLLIQGYPLIGFFLGCLGIALCTGGIAVFAFGLILRKQEVVVHE